MWCVSVPSTAKQQRHIQSFFKSVDNSGQKTRERKFSVKKKMNHQLFDSSERQLNPLRPNNDLSQTSPCNIKGVSVSEVMRIVNKIAPVKFY